MPGPGRPFQKGQSGNPSGQRRGLQRLVREMLGRKGFAAVVRTQYEIATGTFRSDSKIGLQAKEVTAAATWLRDTGGYKAPASVDVTSAGEPLAGGVTVGLDPVGMTDEQLAAMAAQLEAATDLADDECPTEDDDLGGPGTLDDPGPTYFEREEEPDADPPAGVRRRTRDPGN